MKQHKLLTCGVFSAVLIGCVHGMDPVVGADFLGPTEAGIEAGFVTPADKGVRERWGDSLFEAGQRQAYQGDRLFAIGMPCGGIGAGQLYVRGDGTLGRWLIFGQHFSTHWSQLKDGRPREFGYHTYRPKSELLQGFALQVRQPGREPRVVTLSGKDFDDIRFVGEYPIAEIAYRSKTMRLPVEVDLEVFMPWIPLEPRQSAYPATILRFELTNTSDRPVEADLAGWLENGVCLESAGDQPGASRVNRIRRAEGLTFLSSSAVGEGDGGGEMAGKRDFGTMGLALLGGEARIRKAGVEPGRLPGGVFAEGGTEHARAPITRPLVGALGRSLTLEPRETRRVVFLVTWHFPHYANPDDRGKTGAVGRMYANWFDDAFDVAKGLAADFDELDRRTHLFRDTYYDTTLPYWFVQRVAMPASTLSTLTSQWWKNGRFYHYEGVGFCAGTCTHVYAYAQTLARLFPSLERNMRERQDLTPPAQDPKTGRVNFRGRDHKLGTSIHASGYAADGQCGVVLRAYREHLMSADNGFLDRNWPKIRMAMEFMIARDGEDGEFDGVIRRQQHSTWDTDFYGANTYIGSLYLAALRACHEMAGIQGDTQAADRYLELQASGTKHAATELWNGDYFTATFPADVPVKPSRSWGNIAVQYADGCFSNQLFGQNFASQLGLGYVYPRAMVEKTLGSIYRYNWLPDMNFLYAKGKPYQYVIANEGEAGLLQGTWPLDKRPVNAVKLTEHVWTGFEYQVASHMLYEGMVEEGLAIIRGIHERYDGAKHNPWNEIEGGDHYGRAMASWACLTNISGCQYDGPKGALGFAPRITPEDFKCFFSGAEGWGSFEQKREGNTQSNRLAVKWGRLQCETLSLEVASGKVVRSVIVKIAGETLVASRFTQEGQRLLITFDKRISLNASQSMDLELNWEER